MRRLGPYLLSTSLGRGGMCEVWRATGASGEPAAVKILGSEFPAQVLHDEIHLMARLDHPNIVKLYAWGEASEHEAQELGLEPGVPWVAMELAEGGHLQGNRIATWSAFREFALSVLDALMYSHARAVIHRDIKPANVLVMGTDTVRYALTDFGIAFPKSRFRQGTFEVPMAAAGTLAYISPEQLLGRWRDFGRATDLFSLGAMLYELVSGQLPFRSNSRVAVALAHSNGPAPIDGTRFDVPTGFHDWLGKLLAYAPADRYAFAADAAYALLALGGVDEHAPRTIGWAAEDLPTVPDIWAAATRRQDAVPGTSVLGATIHLGGDRPPMPTDWRLRAGGALVGREAERDSIWAQLKRVVSEGVSRAVVLRGADGVGTSALARWICERACEVGAADHVFLHTRGGASTLADTLRHLLGVAGLTPRDRAERLSELLEGSDVDHELLIHLVKGLPTASADAVFVVERVLAHFGARRPLVIWIDDAHYDFELLQLVTALCGCPHPVLFVLTVRDESLTNLPYESRCLRELLSKPGATDYALASLSASDLTSILKEQELSATERAAVVAKSRGSALRATLLVHAYRARGVVPDDDLDELWRQRLRDQLSELEQRALLAAAVLGDALQLDVVERLCKRVHIVWPPNLVDKLLGCGLLSIDHQGCRFVHGSLRQALLNDPAHTAEVRALHLVAATLYNADSLSVAAIRARHMISGGDLEAGTAIVWDAGYELYREGMLPIAKSLSHWLGQVIEGDPAATVATRLRYRLILAHEARFDGELDRSREIVDAVIADAEALGHDALIADGLYACSQLASSAGDLEAGLLLAERAAALASAADDDSRTRIAHRLGWCLLQLGRAAAALPHLERAGQGAAPAPRMPALVTLAHALMALDRPADARRALVDAVELAHARGARLAHGHALNSLAELERSLGEFDLAEKHYDEALRHVERIAVESAQGARLNLAALLIARARPAEARDLIRSVLTGAELPLVVAYGEVLLAVTAAMDGLTAVWEELLPHERHLRGFEFAELWATAGDAWRGRGDLTRAHRAYQEALAVLVGSEGVKSNDLRTQLNSKLRAST